MIKLFIKLFFVFSLVLSFASQATLITAINTDEISADNYIVYEYNNILYDVAWASKVNSQRWYFDNTFNTLFAPTIQSGWEYATLNGTNNLDIFSGLSGTEILALFTDSNNNLIQAFEYWNSEFSSTTETSDILAPRIRSEWIISWDQYKNDYPTLADMYINNIPGASYDTFYIRPSLANGNGSTPVPEPSTLMTFALGLIALACKKRLFK